MTSSPCDHYVTFPTSICHKICLIDTIDMIYLIDMIGMIDTFDLSDMIDIAQVLILPLLLLEANTMQEEAHITPESRIFERSGHVLSTLRDVMELQLETDMLSFPSSQKV